MNENTAKGTLLSRKPWLTSIIALVVIFGALTGFLVWQSTAGTVSIEDSVIDAPTISLSPTAPGTLNAVYVKVGQTIEPNTPVALVGTNTISAKEGGIVSFASNSLGAYYNPGQPVVSVVATNSMRVRGSIEETKGLKKLAVGQEATFTVDAFPGVKYTGVVDEISTTANDANLAYSISDKRPIKRFDVYVRFNWDAHPEIKNGMSAKITVDTNK